MLSVKKYRDWYYGISYDAFRADAINIGVFSPEELQDIIDSEDFNVLTICLEVDDSIRLMRSIERDSSNCMEICRRFIADNEDFAKMRLHPDYVIKNYGTIDKAVLSMRWAIEQNLII